MAKTRPKAKTKFDKDQPILRKLAKHTERIDDEIRSRQYTSGVNTGFGLQAFMARLFEENEELPVKEKFTDAMIVRVLEEEFPDSKCVQRLVDKELTVNHFRSKYNLGKLTQGRRPDKKSHRYNVEGLPISRYKTLLSWSKYPPHLREQYKRFANKNLIPR